MILIVIVCVSEGGSSLFEETIYYTRPPQEVIVPVFLVCPRYAAGTPMRCVFDTNLTPMQAGSGASAQVREMRKTLRYAVFVPE